MNEPLNNARGNGKRKGIELVVSKSFLVFNILLLLVAVPSLVLSYSIDTGRVWHPLQWITTNDAALNSVDADGNGIIDAADRCAPGAICETRQVKITGGNPAAGKVLVSDKNGVGSWGDAGNLPTGTILYFNAATCPPGWVDSPEEQGMYMVGLTAGGTPEGTVGTPLANREDRPIGKHTHALNEIAHYHTIPQFVYLPGGTPPWLPYAAPSKNVHGATWAQPLKTAAPAFSGLTSSTTGTTGTGNGTNAPYIQLKACKLA